MTPDVAEVIEANREVEERDKAACKHLPSFIAYRKELGDYGGKRPYCLNCLRWL